MMQNSGDYKLMISGGASDYYPIQLYFGVLYGNNNADEDVYEIPKRKVFCNRWGEPVSHHFTDTEGDIPKILDAVWLSIVERKFYSVLHELPTEKMKELFGLTNEKSKEPIYEYIVIGMAPYGGVAVWAHGFKKSVAIAWLHGEETYVEMKDFMPLNPRVTLDENCDFYINNNPKVKENLEKNGLPPRDLFDRYMQQFNYRYVVEFGHWDEELEEWKPYEEDETRPEFDYIDETLYDGTHDKLHDGGLMEYHQAGKPQKIALQWHIKKSEYQAFLWMDDMKIRAAFEAFYHEYPDTSMDFIFRIDPQKNKYQILFNSREADLPVLLNEETYQMIVFKSRFEHYRSKNYDQPRGAWIW